MAKNIGELLVRDNLIDVEQLEHAKKEQRVYGGRLASTLVKLGYVSDSQLSEFLAKQYQVPAIDLSNFEIEADVVKSIPKEICEKHIVLPISKEGNTLVLAMADPSNIFARDDISFLTRCKLEVVVASEHEIVAAIEKYYVSKVTYESIMTEIEQTQVGPISEETVQVEIVDVDKNPADAPIIKFVNLMLTEAIKMRSSDIHIEPYEKRCRVRFRVDGTLYEKIQPPPGIGVPLATRIKVMSKLDISERRRPQDGRLKINVKGKKETEFRVSVLPTVCGEKICMRILDKSNLQLDMSKLGFEEDEMRIFKESILAPYGLILITGPTGSGKTTTIYSALSTLNQPDINISTAEDPVEFNIDGINQVQMNADIDLNFSAALRSFLRQDPDVIMVGEIRDYETADIAVKAAQTGHLVVSTLHTNDTAQTVSRLVNMGFEPVQVCSAVNLILAQRLVRKICERCKVPFKVEPQVLLDLGAKEEELKDYQVMRGNGCNACMDLGYKGRIAIYELLKFNDELKNTIYERANPNVIKKKAVELGMRTLRMNALQKLKSGQTTIEEVADNTAKDEL